MHKLAFLCGEVCDGGHISDTHNLFYILEEVSWLTRMLELYDATVHLCKSELKVVAIQLQPSSTVGLSCIRLTGTLPDDERMRHWLGWAFPSVPIRYPYQLTWEELFDARQRPFQAISRDLNEYNAYLTAKYPKRTRQPFGNCTLSHKVSMEPQGLVYHFETMDKRMVTSPSLGWERLRKSLEPHRQQQRNPRRQMVLVQTQV